MRLGDLDALQKKFEGLKETDGHATGRNAYDLCAMLTEDAPTIDHEELRPKGRWVFDAFTAKHGNPYICSRCNTEYGDTHNYCPHCGAKMEGGA